MGKEDRCRHLYLHLLPLQGVELCLAKVAPPVSAPVGFPRGVSHNDQADETRGLEGGTKLVKGLSASEKGWLTLQPAGFHHNTSLVHQFVG